MISAAVEPWEEFRSELEGMIEAHYRQLALNQDQVPLAPMWEQYAAKDEAGQLVLVVARQNKTAIGYYIGFCTPHMHYGTCLTLFTDIFFIREDARKGWAGARLFHAVEEEARRRGVQRWIASTKLHSDAGPLLRYLRFAAIETVYSKWIGPV